MYGNHNSVWRGKGWARQIKAAAGPSGVHHGSPEAPARLPDCRNGACMLMWPASLSLDWRGLVQGLDQGVAKPCILPRPPHTSTCLAEPAHHASADHMLGQCLCSEKIRMFRSLNRASSPRICGCRAQSDCWALAPRCSGKDCQATASLCV